MDLFSLVKSLLSLSKSLLSLSKSLVVSFLHSKSIQSPFNALINFKLHQ